MSMRPASIEDIGQLVEFMGEFYAESGYAFDASRAALTFREVVNNDERLGKVWVIQNDNADVGYMVVTVGYSMEYGGPDAFIDDLFIRPAARNAGLGSKAVEQAREFCVRRGVRALHLETEQGNAAALSLYRKAGFESKGRQLLTLRLSTL